MKRGTKKEIKALFWNVAGTKTMQKEDWDYIRKHEIIGLVKT